MRQMVANLAKTLNKTHLIGFHYNAHGLELAFDMADLEISQVRYNLARPLHKRDA